MSIEMEPQREAASTFVLVVRQFQRQSAGEEYGH
jgi:hypothetical protein